MQMYAVCPQVLIFIENLIDFRPVYISFVDKSVDTSSLFVILFQSVLETTPERAQ